MPETRSQQLMKSNKLSPDLAAIVGKTKASRIELIKLLGAYLKKNKLECEDDKQFFLPDEKMAKVFGTEKIQGFSMAKRIQAHLTPIDTIDGSGDVENDSGDIAGDSDDFEVTFKFPVNDPDDLEIIFQKQPKKQGDDDSNQEPKEVGDDSNQERMQGDDDSNQERMQGDDDSNQELKQGDDDSNQERMQGDNDSNQEPKQGDDDSNQERMQGDDDSNQEPKEGDNGSNDDSNQEPKQGGDRGDRDARGVNYTNHINGHPINACPTRFKDFKASLDDDSYEEAYDLAAIEQWKIDGDSRNINKIHRLKRIILACLPNANDVVDDAAYKKK